MNEREHNEQGTRSQTRRDFMKATAALSAAAALGGAKRSTAQQLDKIRVGLVGCGRRGTGAASDCLKSSDNVELVALGDIFKDKLDQCRKDLSKLGEKVKVKDEHCFTGFDAYKNVLASGVDLVLLATPPAFRPQQLKAAIEAGKHVFMEKPVAVDPAGVRSILATSELAAQKKLAIVAGTQRRHQSVYVEMIKRLHDGAIGPIVSADCYWIGDYDYYKAVPRQAEWSDMEYQLRNWNYYTWLSGDHIVEQHVHNIDVVNWALQAHPVKAIGMGGRQQRTGAEYGHIYDHFAVEFEYPGGVRVTSLCRQNAKTVHKVSEFFVGEKGTCVPQEGKIFGANAYTFDGEKKSPYVQEHADNIAAIRKGEPLNEGKAIAESTLTAIMGRMSAYTGQEVTWDWALNESKLVLMPEKCELGPLAVPPVAIPGVTELV